MKDKNKKLGQEPAFPCEVGFLDGEIRQQHQNGNYTALDNGMSKRFYAACAAMQGILSGKHENLQCNRKGDSAFPINQTLSYNFEKIAINAFKIADELLKQENNE